MLFAIRDYCFLTTLCYTRPMNSAALKPPVVFVVAHPDDVAFSMGGTARLHKDRYHLHVKWKTRYGST